MPGYWNSLQLRERLLLVFTGVILVLLWIYLQLLEPFYQNKALLLTNISSGETELQWMMTARDEVKNHAKSGSQNNQYKGALLSTLDQSTRKNGLSDSVDRIQPDGERVQIWFKNASFDQLIIWMGKITRQYGIEVDTVVIETGNNSGLNHG